MAANSTRCAQAWRLHAGSERIDAQAALRIWEQLLRQIVVGAHEFIAHQSRSCQRQAPRAESFLVRLHRPAIGAARRPMRAIIIRRSRRLECVARRDSRAAGQSHSFAIARKSRRAVLADAARTEPWKKCLLGRGIAYAAARLHRRRVA